MKNTLLALITLTLLASFLTSCATEPGTTTTTTTEVKKDRTKSSMYAR